MTRAFCLLFSCALLSGCVAYPKVYDATRKGTAALEYFFYAGTTPGSFNLAGRSTGLGLSTTVTNLPTKGALVYVRLWTRFATGWQYTDYTFKAASR